MNVGLVCDLRDEYVREGFSEDQVAEFDSRETVNALLEAIGALGYGAEFVGHGRRLAARLVAGERWDLVFNIAEGLHGRSREAQVPCLLEMFGLRYTFSDPLVCALTLDKAMAKRVARAEGVRTPGFAVVAAPRGIAGVNLRYPLFAKPVAEGTGKGVAHDSRIETPDQLRRVCTRLLARYDQPVLVEEYLPGIEVTTGILGTGPEARVLGTMQVGILPEAPSRDYGYQIKEECERYVRYQPMPAGPLRCETEALALAAYRALECRDGGRVDIRMDDAGRPAFLEVNPLPGLHPTHSDLPMIAAQEGLSFRDLIGAIIGSALRRPLPGRPNAEPLADSPTAAYP